MSMAEKYIRASTSPRLKLEPEPTDVDVIIAAGLADSLGTVLLRCQQEWDAERGELERMEETLLRNQVEAERTGKHHAIEGMAQFYEAKQTLLTSRVLAMMAMRSLPVAYVALQRLAMKRVLQRKLELQIEETAEIVHNALDVWLDQRCNHCFGTKETGVYGGPRAICNKCRGTGVRRRVFETQKAHAYTLGEWLIAEMERLSAEAKERMSRSKRTIDAAKRKIEDAAR